MAGMGGCRDIRSSLVSIRDKQGRIELDGARRNRVMRGIARVARFLSSLLPILFLPGFPRVPGRILKLSYEFVQRARGNHPPSSECERL